MKRLAGIIMKWNKIFNTRQTDKENTVRKKCEREREREWEKAIKSRSML